MSTNDEEQRTNDEVFGDLVRLIDSEEAIAFVGSGASAETYPLWGQLICTLAREAKRTRATEEQYEFWMSMAKLRPQLAVRDIRLILGEAQFGATIEDIFKPKPAKDGKLYTAIHGALMDLPFRGYVTTNFDHGLLYARGDRRGDIGARGNATWRDTTACYDWYTNDIFKKDSCPILFAHGQYTDHQSIVLGEGEYRKAYWQGSSYRRLFEKLWGLDRLVFVGFGFTDLWLQFIADQVVAEIAAPAAGRPRHFALLGLRDDQFFPREMRRTFQDVHNAQVYFYKVRVIHDKCGETEDHSELAEKLRELSECCRVRARSVAPRYLRTTPLSLVGIRRNETTLVDELRLVETRYLQVLVDHFTLRRNGSTGAKLIVDFDFSSHAIWRPEAKSVVRDATVRFEANARRHQAELDKFLLRHKGQEFEFIDEDFRFRYASGGALPVVQYKGSWYYCLFYRDVFPVGWNIANGGCHSVEELMDPIRVIHRELSEELMIVTNPDKWFLFEWDLGQSSQRPYLQKGIYFWDQVFKGKRWKPFSAREQLQVQMTFLEAPDSLSVGCGLEKPSSHDDLYVNINALDFGIEIDKVARIQVEDSVILLDGELNNETTVNRPIGLFRCERVNAQLRDGCREFLPEILFHTAKRIRTDFRDYILKEVPRDLTARGVRTEEEIETEFKSADHKFDLCPVTKRLIVRYAGLDDFDFGET